MKTLITKTARAIAMATALMLMAAPGMAHDVTTGDLTIRHAKARPNLPNRPTAAYMTIANAGTAGDRLISASTTAFGTVELHTVEKDGAIMKMKPVDAIEIPAGGAATLAPGGLHLMLFDGAENHKVGDTFPLELVFEKAGEVTITVKVEKIGHRGHGNHTGHGHKTQ